MNETRIIDALRSRDLERQAEALDEAVRVVRKLISESVRSLAEAEHPFPIAAKIFQFGPLVIPELEDLWRQPLSDRTRDHAAALLLELGSRTGVPHLLSLLEHQGDNSNMAACVLGKARIVEAAPPMRRVLDDWDCATDPYTAATFIDALNQLGAMPEALKESLRRKWPRAMQAALDKLLDG